MTVIPPRIALRKSDILSEMVAAWLWMQLTLPADISREEMEACAATLIEAARWGAQEAAIEQKLKTLQTEQFVQPLNILAVKQLARKICDATRRAMPELAHHEFPLKKVG